MPSAGARIWDENGEVVIGSDAVSYTHLEDVITAKDQVQNVDYAPFEGTKVTGRVESVFLRGLQAVKDGKVVEEKKGEFLKRGKMCIRDSSWSFISFLSSKTDTVIIV